MGASLLFAVLISVSALFGVGIRRLTGWCRCGGVKELYRSFGKLFVGAPPS